jgi:hypothetical protein
MLIPVEVKVEPNRKDLVYMSQTPILASTTITTMANLARFVYEACAKEKQ